MPGVMSRDGVILEMPVFDAATRSKMLDAMVSNFLANRQDAIREKIAELKEAE